MTPFNIQMTLSFMLGTLEEGMGFNHLFTFAMTFISFNAYTCLWDRDTIKDELKRQSSIYDLITWQIPTQSEKYYLKRIEELSNKELTLELSHDISVAYIRTKQYDKAEKLLLELIEKYPVNYYVNSNLVVFYKKTNDFEKAYKYIKAALELKKEGHMGLGDWYLKCIDYDRKLKEGQIPNKNFLGEDYNEIKFEYLRKLKVTKALKERYNNIKKLILNDHHFADAYLVLGDILWQTGSLNLALRSYIRAQLLEHPNKAQVNKRIDAIIHHWKSKPYRENIIKDIDKIRKQQIDIFSKELDKARIWLNKFKALEEDLIDKKVKVDLSIVKKNMRIKPFYPK